MQQQVIAIERFQPIERIRSPDHDQVGHIGRHDTKAWQEGPETRGHGDADAPARPFAEAKDIGQPQCHRHQQHDATHRRRHDEGEAQRHAHQAGQHPEIADPHASRQRARHTGTKPRVPYGSAHDHAAEKQPESG